MKQNAWEWTEQDLLDLIEVRVQESVELDYKQCDALQKSDGKKNEISKDVSAFANSAGGIIVYGMKEDGHIPTDIDCGYDPNDVSKEWLEQVINSRIQRRIDGIRVNQVVLATVAPGKVAYVVVVPQSNRAPHQAADKRFYKRFNFESVPMEEYEIRDVAARSSTPDLDIDFAFRPGGATTPLLAGEKGFFAPIKLAAVIRNDAVAAAEYAVVHLYLDKRIKLEKPGNDVRVNPDMESVNLNGISLPMQKLTVLWDRSRGLPIFSGISAELPLEPLRIAIPSEEEVLLLQYCIGSPSMATKLEIVALTVKDGLATLQRPTTTSAPAKLDAA